ncbi:hypothetical protein C8J57DRAFT_1257518 [Mycena rebaudengoi]|nr:hypothetical protein C8J57DRAFT_1257518 [Mycena rebaudengoi]
MCFILCSTTFTLTPVPPSHLYHTVNRIDSAMFRQRRIQVSGDYGNRDEREVAGHRLMSGSFNSSKPSLFVPSNFLRMMECSPEVSPEPFIIYEGEVEGSADRILTAILREEVLKCLILGVLIY